MSDSIDKILDQEKTSWTNDEVNVLKAWYKKRFACQEKKIEKIKFRFERAVLSARKQALRLYERQQLRAAPLDLVKRLEQQITDQVENKIKVLEKTLLAKDERISSLESEVSNLDARFQRKTEITQRLQEEINFLKKR